MAVEELANQIEEDIVFGVYPPTSRLVEDRLMERFATSRYIVRGTFAELEARGLVERVPNRGVEVVELTPDEVEELYQLREILETSAARLTPLPAPRELLAQLIDIVEAHEAAVATGDFRKVFRLNIQFHAVQFSMCRNRRLREAIADYARKVHTIRAVKYNDAVYLDKVKQQHREIVRALESEDQEFYVQCVREHLPASNTAYRAAWNLKYGRSEPLRLNHGSLKN